MIGFITGVLVGGCLGYGVAVIMRAAKDEDGLLFKELNMFDDEEIHENCTVQIWKNTVTGETSVGWWQN